MTVGSNELFYTDVGSGPPVILIHGLAGDHTAWAPQVAALTDRYRVVAFDNRGAGQSTQKDEAVSTQDMANDTLGLMDTLGVERAHIVGRSMGGAIAQHVAVMRPERVASLALCASFARLDPLGHRVLHSMREVLEWTSSWEHHALHSVPYFVSPQFFNNHEDEVRNIVSLIGSETRLQACYIRQNEACHDHDTVEVLAEISCPTLVLAGGRDPICSLTATNWLFEGLRNAELKVFADSSHFFMMEEAGRFRPLLDDWLDSKPTV